MIIVILKMDHTWRHDFYSSIKANEFAKAFKNLNRYVGHGIKDKIGVEIYEESELPEEYKNMPSSLHINQYI